MTKSMIPFLGQTGMLNSVAIFATWTFTSFMCHRSAKQFFDTVFPFFLNGDPINGIVTRIVLAAVVTIAQTALCYATTEVTYTGSYLHIAQTTHVLATFATNLSMTMMYASSTFSIKLMEPITSAIMQYLILDTPLSPLAILSLPFIVGGAIGFSGNPVSETQTSFGMIAAFASNVMLAYRNIALKQMRPGQETAVGLRRPCQPSFKAAMLNLALFLLLLEMVGQVTTDKLLATLVLISTSMYHVIYSYVSTGFVLKQLSVVSHAVANILKRLLVVLLLYAVGQRMASPANWLGLFACAAGLAIYTWDKLRPSKESEESSANDTPKTLLQQTKYRHIFRLLVLSVSIFLCLGVFLLLFSGVPLQSVIVHLSTNKYGAGKPELNQVGVGQTFGALSYTKPSDEELLPDLSGYLKDNSAAIQTFLQERLINTPERANFLSEKLRTHTEVIKEAQRLHFNIMGDALKKYKHSMLFDFAAFENKGDPAISVGELLFLARINLPVLYTCKASGCTSKVLEMARKIAKKYTKEELVILLHGGGNIIGYKSCDTSRFHILQAFKGYDLFVFPQSIYVKKFTTQQYLNMSKKHYCCNENLTIVLRDLTSYNFAKEHFKGSTRLLMAPDMVFQIGNVYRIMPPVFDIMWIKRKDGETPGYTSIPKYPSHIRIHVADWWKWLTPFAPFSVEKATYITVNGMLFLQRGRVVVSDRLHGHILSTLMNIPHVLIDNKFKKLSSYHNTWTKSLENTVLTDDPNLGVNLSLALLEKYQNVIPPRIIYPQLSESFTNYSFEKVDFNTYP